MGEGAQALSKIETISTENADPLLADCQFQVACDVTNPLCGPNGATYIYGPQKGVTKDLLLPIDQGMAHYAKITAQQPGPNTWKPPAQEPQADWDLPS